MCASLVTFRQFAFELSCGQTWVVDGQMARRTDRRIQAMTVPLRPDRLRGKNWGVYTQLCQCNQTAQEWTIKRLWFYFLNFYKYTEILIISNINPIHTKRILPCLKCPFECNVNVSRFRGMSQQCYWWHVISMTVHNWYHWYLPSVYVAWTYMPCIFTSVESPPHPVRSNTYSWKY